MGRQQIRFLAILALSVVPAVAGPTYTNFTLEGSFSTLASAPVSAGWVTTSGNTSTVPVGSVLVNAQLLYWTPSSSPDLTAAPATGTARTASFSQTYQSTGSGGVNSFFAPGVQLLQPGESAFPAASLPSYLIWRLGFTDAATGSPTAVRGFGVELAGVTDNPFSAVLNAYTSGSSTAFNGLFLNSGMPGGLNASGFASPGFMGVQLNDSLRLIDRIDVISLAPADGRAYLGAFYVDDSGYYFSGRVADEVPEPGILMLIGSGLAAFGCIRLRRARMAK